jgi:hypothetical protein
MGVCVSRIPDACANWRGGGRGEGRLVADPGSANLEAFRAGLRYL